MFIGDRVFIPSGGYAMDCESYIRNGDKLGQDIVNYFKGIGKTDSEIRDIDGAVGYCCNCSGGFAAKYMPGAWINQNHTMEEGEIIGCQTGTKIGPFGHIDPIFNTILILKG